ncbi:MAG: tetratricopeptide repeat protein [Chloroflexi bacterium]|nr:tetratricopeptide repeat protein [Chloroflexota bacterium]
MLTLHLTITNNQVSVRANGKESHQFSLLDLSQSEQEWKDFYKNPRVYGEKLFDALFRDAARAEFDVLSKQSERTIVLVLESPELDGVAWEYAYNKAKEEYVVEDCAFVRALPEKERPANGRMKNGVDRVPLLFIPANPLVDLSGEPMRALDVDGEWREMKRLIEKSAAPFDMLELRPATPEALQSVMARFQNGMIAHFSGHGAATKDGAMLLFERENGASNPLEAREFVREIKDKAWIGFLSACQSAVPERTEFSNLARELAKAGVPFALGMQFNLPDPFAPNISGQFYNYLAHGHAVPEAARQARRAVKRENEFHEIMVGMIALYAAHPDEVGKLVWRGATAQTVSLFRPADVSDLPSPASGLIGRQRELMRIGTRLLEGKKPLTVTLHGAGGIGKTALLWQTLLRFAPSFELTLAIGLDPLPSLESVLGRVERFLGLPSPCSNDTKEREALVRNALTRARTLLGLDNFETLIHARDNGTNDEKKTAKSLYAFFQSLPAAGVTLCVTSREKTALSGEGEMEEIRGLEDAMGGRLFYEKAGTRQGDINVDDGGLEKLSAAVGGLPLALQLLAPIFEEQAGLSLEQFIEKLQTFLPKASDQWTEEDRHTSLRACFAFSMDNLPKNEEGEELQIAISRLSVFTAFFVDVIVAPILENYFPQTIEEFSEIRERTNNTLHALWERGLLERALASSPENENYYMYRLHPVLGFFAKERLTNIETVKENYWKSMNNLAHAAEVYVTTTPFWARIVSEALPDLLHATEMKYDMDTSLMQFRLGKVLELLGLYDEALHLLKKAHEISGAYHYLQGESATLFAIAGIHVIRGNIDEALQLYRQSLEIFEALGDEGVKDKANTMVEMGNIYNLRGELDKSMKHYQQAREIYNTLGDAGAEGRSIIIRHMANILRDRGDLDGAIELHQQASNAETGNLLRDSIKLGDMALILKDRGDLDGAIELYQQALENVNLLGALRNKSIILVNLADTYVSRNNPSKAMELLDQALEISEEIDDKEGTAHNFYVSSRALWVNRMYEKAIPRAFISLLMLADLKIEPQFQRSIVSDFRNWRKEIGAEKFDALWRKEIGQPVPEWLAQQPDEEEGMTAEQFIAGAIQSAREKRPEAEEYFKSAQKMAADSSVPAEMRELGRVLQRIMIGDRNVDLSSLPREWAEAVKRTIHEYNHE